MCLVEIIRALTNPNSLLNIQSNAILINVFRPPFSRKNVDKKGNFPENLVNTKRKSVPTKSLGLFIE